MDLPTELDEDTFQLTTSRGGRRKGVERCLIWTRYFNSRPHEEVDERLARSSLHLLAFQFTTSRGGRRLTDDFKFICRIFQLTTSRGGRRIRPQFPSSILYFNSRPHEEVDDSDDEGISALNDFNSRPHEEVDACFARLPISEDAFQLTTSRGGRQPTAFFHPLQKYFNSRPHEEVDGVRVPL